MTIAALCRISCCAIFILVGACSDSKNRPAAASNESGQRIVTLAPHLAEMLHAVGADDRLIAVSAFTDYPPMVADLPVIGDAFGLDQEKLLLLEPDLLLAWESGTPVHVIDELRSRGYRVETIVTTSIYDVPEALIRIGLLTDRSAQAKNVANQFSRQITALVENYADADAIRVFYQVDARPLYTVNGAHFISEVISACGGENIFADLDDIAPLVSMEAVIERDPEVLLAGVDAGDDVFDHWDRWRNLDANRYGNRFRLTNNIARPTPRIIQAARAVCGVLDQGRANRLRVGND